MSIAACSRFDHHSAVNQIVSFLIHLPAAGFNLSGFRPCQRWIKWHPVLTSDGIQLISHKLVANAVVVDSSGSGSSSSISKRTNNDEWMNCQLSPAGCRHSTTHCINYLGRITHRSAPRSYKNANPRLNGLALEQPLAE
jgi:hypothetical protein